MKNWKMALVVIGILLNVIVAYLIGDALDSVEWGIAIAIIPCLIYEFWGWWGYRFHQVVDFFKRKRTLGEWFELSIMWICISFILVWIYFAGQ